MEIRGGTLKGAEETQLIERKRTQELPEKEKKTNHIYSGTLNLIDDPITKRKKDAQETAWSIINSAWKNDKNIDDSIRKRREHYADMEGRKKEAADGVLSAEGEKEKLRELYGVAAGSQEQKALELLEKEQDLKNGVVRGGLTKEETDALAKIHTEPLTEYQVRALEYHNQAGEYKKIIGDAERHMRDDTADIRGIESERLKSNPMLDAKQAADTILETANDEIIGMLIQEAKNHIDEKMEEAEEKAEKSMEEKEKKEKGLQEMKIERALQEAMIEGSKEAIKKAKNASWRNDMPDLQIMDMVTIVKNKNTADNVGKSLNDIKNSMSLLEADLKGIKVDEEA